MFLTGQRSVSDELGEKAEFEKGEMWFVSFGLRFVIEGELFLAELDITDQSTEPGMRLAESVRSSCGPS